MKNEANCLFEASLESVIDRFDEVIVIDGGSDDGTLELLDKYDRPNLRIIHKKWVGSDGLQREQYLKYAKGDWILVIDADEVLSDNGVELYNLAMKADEKGVECFAIHMYHFFYHLGLVDSSTGGHLPRDDNYEHYVPGRFFKNKKGIYYEYTEHTIIRGHKSMEKTNAVTLFHYSDCRGLFIKVIPQSNIDFKRSNNHEVDYMKWWRMSRVLGGYPVKPFKAGLSGHPAPIRRLVEIENEA